MDTGGFFPEGKTAEAWSWPSPPSNAEWWCYTSTPQHVFIAWYLINYVQRQLYLYHIHMIWQSGRNICIIAT
jgi:hypothetical protein